MPKPQAPRKLGRNEPLKGERLVRIKKLNPRRGLKLGTYAAVWKGKRYEWSQVSGWKKVPLGFAKYLSKLPSTQGVNPGGEGDEDAPRAFWVASTIAEAQGIDERERKMEEKANKPREAMSIGDLAVSDLRAQSRFDEDEDDEEEDEEEPPADEENDEEDEELRDIKAQAANAEERMAARKARKAAEAAEKASSTPERSMRAPKEEERVDAASDDEEDEEEKDEDDDGDPDLNNGAPVDIDFDKDVKPAPAAAKPASAKPAAKKAAQKKKGRGKNR